MKKHQYLVPVSSPPALPACITGCFRTRALLIDELKENAWFYIVYALGEGAILRRLRYKGLRSIEFVTDTGIHHFTVKLIAEDEYGADLLIGIDDINLSGNSSQRYTNHHAFKTVEDAEFYRQLCKDFNIRADHLRLQP